MSNTVIIGTQWGDEGKGHIVDFLAEKRDIVCRYAGGANAGHTVIVGDTQYITHLVPSGILHKGKVCIIGNGVVIDPISLSEEMAVLKKQGLAMDNLKISDRAHVIMFYHRVLDKVREMKMRKKIGTTGRGIGPAYADKSSRHGIRVCDLYDPETFEKKLKLNIREKLNLMRHTYDITDEEIIDLLKGLELENFFVDGEFDLKIITETYEKYSKKIEQHIVNASHLIDTEAKKGKTILFEGAQGTMLDIDHGTFPYVTSSNSTIGGVLTGLGIGPKLLGTVMGIVKAYTTRVGRGPFVTELADEELLKKEIEDYKNQHGKDEKIKLNDDEASKLTKSKVDDNLLGKSLMVLGGEYGATTGRPRRCGWLDIVVVKHAIRVNGMDTVALTKLDVLDKFAKIKICTGYKYKGKTLTEFPASLNILDNCKPIYEEFDGWLQDTTDAKKYDDLPDNAKKYIKKIEEFIGIDVCMVGVGPKRSQTLIKDQSLF